MQTFIEKHDIKIKSRRLLISGLEAKDILLSTTLLQWYLEHGLIITHISEVLEFCKAYPFVKFVDEITKSRREGSRNKEKKILGDLMKLIGYVIDFFSFF